MAEPPAVPPSRKESCGYYTGLLDCLTLVGRSTIVYDNEVYEKLLDPVEKHAVVPLWNDSAGPLRRKIHEAVKGIDWNTIDIFRCGSTSLGHCHLVRPVIPFVSVEPGSITWMSGRAVALKYRDVLREHGIHDVEVEIKESRITQCCSSDQDQTESDRSTAKLEPRIPTHEEESFGRHNIQLSEFLGTKIASSRIPTFTQTGVISEAEMRCPDYESALPGRTTIDEDCTRVCMYGSGSGESYGITNIARSVIWRFV